MAVRSIAPARPLVLFGHSMGGLISPRVRARRAGPAGPARPVRAGDRREDPAVAARPGRDRCASRRDLLSNRLDPDDLSCDAAVGEKYLADPLNQHKSTVRFAHAGFAEQRAGRGSLDRLSMPTLVVHGADDAIVPTTASEPLEGRPGVTGGSTRAPPRAPQRAGWARRSSHDELAWIRDRGAGCAPAGAPSRAGTMRQLKTASGERRRAESVARPQTRGT